MNKFNQWMRSFGRLVLGFALVVTAHPSFKVLAAEKQLTVIGISDLHGALQVERLETLNQQKVERGGASWIASIIQAIKKNTAGPVVIVDAGDMFQGTLVSNSAEGEPVIRFYNFLGVDAAALGNHEFDYGPIGPASYASESIGSDPREALKARIQQANFPLLAANIIDEATHTTPTWAKPSLFIERQGVKIGIVGGATTLTPSTTDKRNLVGLKFLPEAEPLLKEAISLRQRGADFVILTAHIGGGCKDNRSGQEAVLESCRFQDIFHLLDQMPEHTFDFVLGGHTHQQINKMYRGSIILQPAANGSFLALAKLKKSPKQIKTTQELIPVCSAGIKTTDGFSCEPWGCAGDETQRGRRSFRI
jgi:5'-nucleotidase